MDADSPYQRQRQAQKPPIGDTWRPSTAQPYKKPRPTALGRGFSPIGEFRQNGACEAGPFYGVLVRCKIGAATILDQRRPVQARIWKF